MQLLYYGMTGWYNLIVKMLTFLAEKPRLWKTGLILFVVLMVGVILFGISRGTLIDTLFNKSNYNMCGPFWGDIGQ